MLDANVKAIGEAERPLVGPGANVSRIRTLVSSCLVSLVIHAALLLSVATGSTDQRCKVVLDATLHRSRHQALRFEPPTSGIDALPSALKVPAPLREPPHQHRPDHTPSSPSATKDAGTGAPEITGQSDTISGNDVLISLPGPYYREPNELTTQPHLLGDLIFRSQDIVFSSSEGRILIQLLVNNGGAVDDVIVEEADVPIDTLNSTVQTFRSAKYAPGQLNGQAVNAKIKIEIRFN